MLVINIAILKPISAPNLSRLPRDTDCAQIGGGPSGYGPPPPEKDYYSRSRMTMNHDDRLRNRYEACRSGMQELDMLRAKHTLLIQVCAYFTGEFDSLGVPKAA